MRNPIVHKHLKDKNMIHKSYIISSHKPNE